MIELVAKFIHFNIYLLLYCMILCNTELSKHFEALQIERKIAAESDLITELLLSEILYLRFTSFIV